jgi:mono/diheme cytochrome c family protein
MHFGGFYVSGTVELLLVIALVLICEGLLYAFQRWANRQPGDPLEVRSSYSGVLSLVLSWLLILVVGVAWLDEGNRMASAADLQKQQALERGAAIFGQYCVPCHGPIGEGHIGAPLNVPYFKGDPTKDHELYNFLYNTIFNGRPGYGSPHWVKVDDGNGKWHWQSQTAMPAWAQDNNGPLTMDQIRDVVWFIMEGNWRGIPIPAGDANGDWPDPSKSSLPLDQQKAAQAAIEKVGCLGCHTIGSRGQRIGPDITAIDTWGVDKQFVYDWIQDPQRMGELQLRAPTTWNPQYAHQGGKLLPFGSAPHQHPLPPPYMPRLQMDDKTRQLIVDYLFSLHP